MEKSIRVEDDTSIGAHASCTGLIVSVSLVRWRAALVRARTRLSLLRLPPSFSLSSPHSVFLWSRARDQPAEGGGREVTARRWSRSGHEDKEAAGGEEKDAYDEESPRVRQTGGRAGGRGEGGGGGGGGGGEEGTAVEGQLAKGACVKEER